jgi:hypothetical protein
MGGLFIARFLAFRGRAMYVYVYMTFAARPNAVGNDGFDIPLANGQSGECVRPRWAVQRHDDSAGYAKAARRGLVAAPDRFPQRGCGRDIHIEILQQRKPNFVVKQIDVKEFNGYLADNQGARGQPTVAIPSLDEDVLWLRWLDTNGNGISLNSGMDSRRWHAIVEVDNTVCDK